MPSVVYLHGFASGPSSNKGRFLAAHFADIGVDLVLPDLNEGDFSGLTLTRQLALVDRTVREVRPRLLIGSSLGGYLAALYAARQPDLTPGLLLLAPAFGFAERLARRLGPEEMSRWKRRGTIETFHYAEERTLPLSYGLYEDARSYPAFPNAGPPTLILHGSRDRGCARGSFPEVCGEPVSCSAGVARFRPRPDGRPRGYLAEDKGVFEGN